jgi:hypothetical protein
MRFVDRLRQICTAERLEQMDGFRNRHLRLFRLFYHDYTELRARWLSQRFSVMITSFIIHYRREMAGTTRLELATCAVTGNS